MMSVALNLFFLYIFPFSLEGSPTVHADHVVHSPISKGKTDTLTSISSTSARKRFHGKSALMVLDVQKQSGEYGWIKERGAENHANCIRAVPLLLNVKSVAPVEVVHGHWFLRPLHRDSACDGATVPGTRL